MNINAKRYPKNASGPFFVNKDECIACGAPEHEAPDLIVHDEQTYHCYFKRRPATPEEVERAIQAICVSCVGALQYCGDDLQIRQRIEEVGKANWKQYWHSGDGVVKDES